MLETLRQGVQSWYFKALLLLLVASFAIWGVGDIFRTGPSGNHVMTVGGKDVSPQEIRRIFLIKLDRLSRSLGTQITTEQAKQLGIVDQSIQQAATLAQYDAEAANLGVTTGPAQLAKSIRQDPTFRSAQGKFSRGVFEQVINAQGLNEQTYVDEIRKATDRNQLLGSFVDDLPVSSVLTERLFKWRDERRVADYVIVKRDPTAKVKAPDDSVLKAYHKDHADLFTAPAYRKITYLLLTPADAKKDVTISDDEVKSAYQNRIDEFSQPERRTVQQMILPDEATAKKAEQQLAAGGKFLDLAKEMAKQTADTTDLGDVTKNSLPDDLSKVVFKLGKDQVSPPVKGPFGWYIFRVTEVKPPSTKPLSEVEKSLRESLTNDKALDVLYKLSNQLEDARGGGQSLDEAAKSIGLKTVTVDAIDRTGRGPDGALIPGIPQGSPLVKDAFDTPVGQASNLLDMPDGGYLVVRVDSETPSALRPFDSVRDKVLAAWEADQRHKEELKGAKTLVSRINEGTTLSAIASELGLGAVLVSPAFTRDGKDAGNNFPRGLVTDMFAAKVGHAAFGETDAGYTIAVLKEIRPANDKTEKTARDAIAKQLEENTASDLIVEYAAALRDRYPVEINKPALDALFVQNN